MIASSPACWAVTPSSAATRLVSVNRYHFQVYPRGPTRRGINCGQIVIYVFARVLLALAKLSIEPNMHPLSHLITPDARAQITDNAWPVFASLSWAFVMYIFRWYPETLISSLRSSMVYMYEPYPDLFTLEVLIMIKLLGLGPLGFVPKPLITQQIEQSLKDGSSAVAYRMEVRFFCLVYPCCLFLMYILQFGEFSLEDLWSIGGRLCRNTYPVCDMSGIFPQAVGKLGLSLPIVSLSLYIFARVEINSKFQVKYTSHQSE